LGRQKIAILDQYFVTLNITLLLFLFLRAIHTTTGSIGSIRMFIVQQLATISQTFHQYARLQFWS